MDTYRFFSVNELGGVLSLQLMQCWDDADALDVARSLATERCGVEVWDAGRRISKLSCAKGDTSAPR
jgi:hypothetical protein